LASGAFFSPFNFVQDGKVVLRQSIVADRLLHYEEALGSTVSVHMNDNEEKYYCINGKTEADQSPRSMVLQRMIGHLPTLFHPNAKKAVNIGLGAGVSFGALGSHPLDHLEVVEIEPAVQRATRVWGELNHNILDNPKAILTFNDGRNHLFATTNRYDVITADPFEPVMAGAANLYTVEYFQLGRNRLEKNGIMGQFLPLYELSLENYLSIVRSFVHVFPNTALFYTGFDTVLIGFKGDVDLQMDTLRRNFNIPSVKQSLEEIGFTSPEMILSMFVADLSQHPEFASSGILNTDDKPYIEYSAPKSCLRYTTDENQSALLHIFTDIPEEWLSGMSPEDASRLKHEHQAVKLMLEGAVYRSKGQITKAYAKLAEAHELSPSNPVVINEMVAMLYASATALQNRGQIQAAAQQFKTALELDPNDFWSLFNMVIINMSMNQPQTAEALLQHALELYPESPLMIGLHGKYLFSQGNQTAGLEKMEKATDMHPGNIGLWNDLNMMASLSGNIELQQTAQQNIERIQRYVDGD
jgi:spermidine synthase